MSRKLSVSRAWEETRAVLRQDGRLIVTVALALLVLPGTIVNMVTPRAAQGQLPEPGTWSFVWVLGMLIGLVGHLAIARLALGGFTVGGAIRQAAARMPIYFLSQLLWMLPFAAVFVLLLPNLRQQDPSSTAALLFLLTFVIFMFLAVRMLLSLPIASAEAAGPIAILRRSWQLSAGNWWRLFGFLMLFLIGASILVLSTAAMTGLLAEAALGGTGPYSVGALLVSLAGQIVESAAYVILVVMLTRLYLQRAGAAQAQASVPSSGT